MVSSETAKLNIIRRAFNPATFKTTCDRDIRELICSHLSGRTHRLNAVADEKAVSRQRADDPAQSSICQDDVKQRVELLRAIRAMGDQFSGYCFVPAPAQQAHLTISGVSVYFRADLLVEGATRGSEQIGAAVLRLSNDEIATPKANGWRRQVGLYVATLARMHVDQNITSTRQPANRLCLCIDVPYREILCAPKPAARRVSDIRSACHFIAALWGRV